MPRPGQFTRSRSGSASSSSSRLGSGGAERSSASPAVESAVTRLLVSIKQLLEGLQLWSQQRMDEPDVSDLYVRFGNDCSAAASAFAVYNIDMQELSSAPNDLRRVLEDCLAEDATPEQLERYMPAVRQIMTSLLQGLREKQSAYRRIVLDHQRRTLL